METIRDVVIVGAGFAGLYAIHRLRQDGLDVLAIERGDDIGGVWNWNRYPGARCDVQSLEYSYSFSEELQQEWRWSEKYSGRDEIHRYAAHVADRFELMPHIRLTTELTQARFNRDRLLWEVTLSSGESLRSHYLLFASGSLTTPNVPDIPGLADFGGQVLHTARWPREAPDLAGKRIGVFGTGSTATQLIPEVAKVASALVVFQRTANYIAPARNSLLSDEQDATWKRQYKEMRDFARSQASGVANPLNPQSAISVPAEERQARFDRAFAEGGFVIMSSYNDFLVNAASNATLAKFFHEGIAARVDDPETARKLTPDYPAGGKRLCLEEGYYEVFNDPRTSLVHLPEEPVERVTRAGIVTSAREFELDVIIFATGFDAITGSVAGADIRGLGNQPLFEYWREVGPRSLMGVAVAGFPNLFLVSGPGSPIGRANAIPTIEHNVDAIAQVIGEANRRGTAFVEARPEAQQRWAEKVSAIAARTLYMKAKSWYNGSNIEGKSKDFMIFVGGLPDYLNAWSDQRAQNYPDFSFVPA